MRQVLIRRLVPCLGSAFVFCQLAGGSWLWAEEKVKPEELVAKSLEALGTPEARAAVKTRVMSGEGSMGFVIGQTGQLNGRAQFASDAERARFEWRFGHPDYDSDQLVFDGKKVLVGDTRPGVRSSLAMFINDYAPELLKEGILGGVTNVGWALSSDRKLRLKYRGLKELRGRKVHVFRYQSAGSSRLHIDLGFDPETYRHVVTEYSLNIPGSTATARPKGLYGQSDTLQSDVYWRASEEFDDFRPVDGITLPHAYKLRVAFEGRAILITEWKAQFSEVKHNQALGADVFTLH
jgi:hypothetical protein